MYTWITFLKKNKGKGYSMKELSERYNGHVIHVLDLQGDIIIGRVHETQKVSLVDN